MKPKKFSLNEISKQLKKPWTPINIAKIDDYILKIAKFNGKYHWHKHDRDELFIVLKGKIKILTKKENIVLNQGEGIKIPKGVEHCPVAINPSIVLMFESRKLKNKRKPLNT